jgi:hypothetical protein
MYESAEAARSRLGHDAAAMGQTAAYRLPGGSVVRVPVGSKPLYGDVDPDALEAERYAAGPVASMTDAEKSDKLDDIIRGRGLDRGELVSLSGGNRDADSLAWAAGVALTAATSGRAVSVVNAEAEIISLSGDGSVVGRHVVNSASRVRAAWDLLHAGGSRQFYDSPGLHAAIKSKLTAKAKAYGVELGGDRKHHDRPKRGQFDNANHGDLGADGQGGYSGGEGPSGGSEGGSGGASLTLELTNAGQARRKTFEEIFGPDQADDMLRQVDRAEGVAGDDPSVDHDAEIARYRAMAGDTSFVQGRASKPGAVSASKTYGSSSSDGGPSKYRDPGPSGRPQSER